MEINNEGYCGFALSLPEDDKRLPNYEKQRLERGWDDTETWNLNTSFAKFLSPRLKRLIEIQRGFIVEPYEGYFDTLENLAVSLDRYIEDTWDEEALKIIQNSFPKVFPYLWW